MLQLYDYYRSSACFRVRIALNLKNLDYETIPIHLLNNGGEQFSTEYITINPQSLVPSLKTNEHIITQSLAIIEYLEEQYPAPVLLPKDPYHRAQIRSFALTIATDLHPLTNLRVLKYLANEFHISEDQKSGWYQHWLAKGFSALETTLATAKQSADFCFGNTPTLADIFLIPQMFSARRFSCDLTAYPILTRIDAHCQTHPAFQKAWPKEP